MSVRTAGISITTFGKHRLMYEYECQFSTCVGFYVSHSLFSSVYPTEILQVTSGMLSGQSALIDLDVKTNLTPQVMDCSLSELDLFIHESSSPIGLSINLTAQELPSTTSMTSGLIITPIMCSCQIKRRAVACRAMWRTKEIRMSEPKTSGADAGSVVSDPQHSQKLLRVLQSFRQDECFQDAELVLEGEHIPVQKNILAAASPYIRTKLNYNPPKDDGSVYRIELQGISVTTMRQILDYIFSGE
ncbi:hypothetical protein DNTS_017757, partial [Danionella cerebrum]